MRDEDLNPYSQDAQGVEQAGEQRAQPRRAVRTILTTVALMGAVVVAMSAILFIESVVKQKPIESFWKELADESWLPLLFAGTLPAMTGDRGGCCCLGRLLRRKAGRSVDVAGGGDPAGATPPSE